MDLIVSPAEAAMELLRRKRGRSNLIGFTEYTMPTYNADPFHHLVARKLEAVERGEIQRLMIFAPPRHGKSELSTRRFPAWFMGRNPHKNVISASYNADFAKTFGREVRGIVQSKEFQTLFPDERCHVRSDNKSADEWQLDGGGKYFAVGVSTGTTGKGAHLFMIDDPIKDRKEADSQTFRQTNWDWYRDVVYTRLEEDAAIILTLTRWHHDDIAGRLIELMNDGKGLPWDILTLPALPEPKRDPATGEFILNEDGSVPGDPLGRKPYEPLAPRRFSYAALVDRQDVLGDRSWSAMYQQKPMGEAGGKFQPHWFQPLTEIPKDRVKVRAWDFANSADGDYTVGVLMSKDKEGRYYIEDVIRFRGSALEVQKRVMETARNDGRQTRIRLPQDPGQAGKDQASRYVRMLAGWNVKAVRMSGDKSVRADAFAAQVEAGNVYIPRETQWAKIYIDELSMFPLGINDDQVDASSDAFNALVGPTKPRFYEW